MDEDLSEREMKVKDQRTRTTATDESTAAATHQAPVSYAIGCWLKAVACSNLWGGGRATGIL